MKKNTLYAWVVWGVSALFFFFKNIVEISPSVMTHELISEYNISATDLGNLTAAYFYSYFLMQIPVGLLLDRFGLRKVTTLAILLLSFGLFIFFLSEHLTTAIFARIIMGVGAAFAAINCLKVISLWFSPHQFAFMTGLTMTVAMLGAIGGEAPLAILIKEIEFKNTIFTLFIIGLLLTIFYFLIARDSPKNLEIKSTAINPQRFSKGLKQIISSTDNWIIAIFSALCYAPISVLGGLWGVPFIMQAHDLSKVHAATLVSLIFLGFAFGAPLFGYLSEKAGRRKPYLYIGTLVSLALILVILYIPQTHITLGLNFFGFGFFISSFMISFTVIHEYNLPIVTATAIGLMNTFNALLGAISDSIIGKFLDLNFSGQIKNTIHHYSVRDYQISLTTLPVYLAIAFLLLLLTKETHCKQRTK